MIEKFPEKPAAELNWWVPAPGNIVKLKARFMTSMEGRAFRRANMHDLKEGDLFEVVEYIQDEDRRALRLKKIQTITVAGKSYNTGVELDFTPSLDLFEPAQEEETS